MLSHSIFLGNNRSELQFIDDLNTLCKRHKVSCGEPQDLAHLGADLVSNDNFRTDLFTLCTAISHMAEVDLSPEQLLILVARSLGGPDISIRNIAVNLPQSASSTFLSGYETWLRREPDPDTSQPRRAEREQTPVSSPRPTLYYSALSRSRSDSPETQDDLPTIPANRTSSHRSIPGNTPLENLTLNELRMYLEDIESRVNRIEPRFEHIAPRRHLSNQHFEPLEALDVQRGHEAMPTAATQHPEPALAPEPAVAAAQTELALDDATPPSLIIPNKDAIALEAPPLERTPNSATAAAHLHRLRIVNAVLTSLLILVCGSAAIFAYRYLYLKPAPFTDAPLRELPSKPSPAAQTTPALNPGAISTAPSSPPTPVHRPNDATQDKPRETNLPEASPVSAPAIHTSVADPPPLADTKVPALSATLPLETPIPPPLSERTIATTPPENHSQPKPSPANAQSDQNQTQPERPGTTAPLVASATSPPPRPTNTPTPAPIPHPALSANATIAVPSSMMMTYVVSAPKPVYPIFRHAPVDTIVDVQTTISKEGKVISARALSGALDVRGAAAQAVQTWRFRPFTLDGTPVAVVTTFKFVFKAR